MPRSLDTMYFSIAAILLLFGCAPTIEPCDITDTAFELAGAGATDCGAVAAGDDATAAWACAVDANNATTPYVMLYDRQGIDSVVTIAMTSNGTETWTLQQDSFDETSPDIDGWDCIDPVEQVKEAYGDDAGGYPIVACTESAPEGNHYQVCGEICEDCGSPTALPFDP